MNMLGTLTVVTNLIHERDDAPAEELPSSERRAADHAGSGEWGATVPVSLRRLAASRTPSPASVEPSGLRRETGTVA
jgi:hypothetical protein